MEMVVMDVCPTEDSIMAFMDHLLLPLLPVKSTKQHTPTLDQQEAVAKQVHAVVILYNYFHRKQHPQLEFLDFVSFCELMTILKPQMLAYMKFMQLSKDKELDDMDVEKRMSLTEKFVVDACCICKQLDTVKDLPTLEPLPICKVAVLLVDAKRENCFLQFGSITQGAWSPIEKEVDAVTSTNHECENPRQPKGVYIRKRSTRKPMSYGEGQFQTIAISAVTEATDINQADLKVLESHIVYSLNKEKAAVRFFIVKCTKSFNIIRIPIRYVIDSLQGPLVKRDCISWSVTEAVAYFHMFPYVAIMSELLARDVTSNEFQNIVAGSRVLNVDKSPMAREPSEAHDADDSDKPISASRSAVHVDSKINTNYVFQRESRGSCKSSMPKTMMMSENLDGNNFLESAKEKKVVPDIHTVKQPQVRGIFCASREKNDNGLQSTIDVEDEIVETMFHKDSTAMSLPPEAKHVLHAIASSGNILSQSALKVILRKREKLEMNSFGSLMNTVLGPNCDTLSLKDAAQQRREIEDEIALCDKTIQSILSGREDDLAIKLESLMEACSDISLTSSDGSRDVVLPKYDDQASIMPMPTKRKKPNNVTPRLQNPCKELDEMCLENNFTTPNYHVSQSRGGFQGTIIVKGEGFEISEKGDWYSNLFEARESAAKHALEKLCKVIGKAK